jgi:hypothetical protein
MMTEWVLRAPSLWAFHRDFLAPGLVMFLMPSKRAPRAGELMLDVRVMGLAPGDDSSPEATPR